jgi:hypothetical protein
MLIYLAQGDVSQRDHIEWTPALSLCWDMFCGFPPENKTEFKAITSSFIRYEQKAMGDTAVAIEITTYFRTDKSWVRDTLHVYNNLLTHEQYHLNLKEVYARKFRREISKLDLYMADRRNYNTIIKNIRTKIDVESIVAQRKYDEDTDHSRNLIEQKRWEKKIDDLLLSLEDYNESKCIIEFKK